MNCEQCRRAEATLNLTYQLSCASREKRLCDACARSIDLPYPFTLKALPLDAPGPESGSPSR
jgi:protein-arginine kinase activator protein McsA